MTNTNDFRRYSFATDSSYLIDSFSVSRSSAAPKLRPKEQEDKGFKVRGNAKRKSESQLKSEQKTALSKILRIAAASIICLGMICLVLNSFAHKNELTREIARKQVAIANAQSENISLESQLNARVSISEIDKIAVEKLGMTKVKSNQIQYVNVDEFRETLTKGDTQSNK